jgi:hypothetical protein
MRLTKEVVGVFAVACFGVLVAKTMTDEKATAAAVGTAPSGEIPADGLEPTVTPVAVASPEPRSAVSPRSRRDLERQGNDLVRRDMARRFGDWVAGASHGLLGFEPSSEMRQQLADTQSNASAALLAHEDAGTYYINWRSSAFSAIECRIRTKEWSWGIDEKLNREEKRDATFQATRAALSEIERGTASAFGTFMIYFYHSRMMKNGREEGCRDLAAMPFMITLDRYGAGLIDQLPRPISSR